MPIKEIKGIRIRTFNYITIIIAVILYTILIYETIHISIRYQFLIETTENYISSEKDAALLDTASDYLTEQVRLFTVNMDLQYLKAYFTELNENCRREQALIDLEKYHSDDEIYAAAQNALDCSNELTKVEIYAMKLVTTANDCSSDELPHEILDMELDEEDMLLSPDDMCTKARSMVFDSAYQDAKSQIQDYISQATEPILADTLKKQQDSADALKSAIAQNRICLSFLLISNALTFAAIIVLVVRPLHSYGIALANKHLLEVAGAYEVKYLAMTYNDIFTQNAANEEMLRQKAERDALTGILNRGAFDHITALLAEGHESIALLLIDVDQFKSINDSYGHDIGDHILQKVSHILNLSFRSSDYVARFGGDEFAVIMSGATDQLRSVILQKADQINHILASPDDNLPAVSLSIGVAFSPNGYSQMLFKQADQTLYQVKEHGRCGCAFYGEVCSDIQ